MAIARKPQTGVIARIERHAFARVGAVYGKSAEHLPASFWARVEESLAAPALDDVLDPNEWLLLQAAREFGYHSGFEIVSSPEWAGFIAPLDSDQATTSDVMHTAFAALSGLGLDDCEIVDLMPFEQLVVRVYGYWGLMVCSPDRTRRASALIVRGLCAAVMDLCYGGPYDPTGRFGLGTFVCSQTRSVERGDACDEFTAIRRPTRMS